MSRPLTIEPFYRERIITARKPHRCDSYPRCATGILAGERYVECTEFPGHDAGWAKAAGHPVRHLLCARDSMGRIDSAVPEDGQA